MAKQTLPVNYKDDVMSSAMGAKRRWQITQNTDGTYNIEDVTTYDQVGSEFGAGDINATNQAVNASADAGKIIDDPDTAEATTEEGYMAGVQLFNHVTRSLANGQISFDVVDGEPYVAVNGGTPRPFDSRHFIVKDGVVQNGYTLASPNGTSIEENYNGNGYLRLYKSNAYCCAYLSVDVTDYNYLIITNPTIAKADRNMFAYIGDSYSTGEAATISSGGTTLNLKEYTGTKVISLISFYGSTKEISADNIWLAK